METVFYTLCAYLPIHLLAYLPFQDELRFGKRWMAVTVAGNLALHLLGVGWAVFSGRAELVSAVGFAMVPVSLALYFLNIRLQPGKLLFTYVLLVNYQILATGLSAFLAAWLLRAAVRSWQSGLICLALFILAWRPMYRLFRYAWERVYSIDAPRLWRVIWLLPAVMCAAVLALTGGIREQAVLGWQFLLSRGCLLLCVVLVYWVLISSLEGIKAQAARQEQLNFEAHLLEVQAEEQQKHSRLILEHEGQLRRQRHDLRHQLAAIRQLADSDPALLREYIDSLLEAIPAAPRSFCENPAVNAVVSYYAARLEDEGVEVRIRLSLPARLEGVTDGEACVVFGNLLENAMEACALVEVGPRFVHLDGEISRGVLAVTMGNSFDGRTFREGGRFRSSKRAEPGVGLSSIQAVARKHGGDARFEADGAVFRCSVYLQAAAAE